MTRYAKELKAKQARDAASKLRRDFAQAKRELKGNVQRLTVRECLCTDHVVRALGYVGVTVTVRVLEEYEQYVGVRGRCGRIMPIHETHNVRVCTVA